MKYPNRTPNLLNYPFRESCLRVCLYDEFPDDISSSNFLILTF